MADETESVAAPTPTAAPVGEAPAEAPKPRRRRIKAAEASDAPAAAEAAPASNEAPKPAGGEAPKHDNEAPRPLSAEAPKPAADAAEPVAEKPKRRPGRPRKVQVEAPAETAETAEAPAEKPKRRPGRPRKVQPEPAAEGASQPSLPGVEGAPQPAGEAPAAEGAEKPAERPERRVRRRRNAAAEAGEAEKPQAEGAAANEGAEAQDHSAAERSEEKPREERPRGRNQRTNQKNNQRPEQGTQGQRQDRAGRSKNDRNIRNNRHKKQGPQEPTLTREELEGLKVADLRAKASELGIPFIGKRKAELVDAVYDAAARAEGFRPVAGILEISGDNFGFIRTDHYMQGEDDAFVQPAMIRQLGLRKGDYVEGSVRPATGGNKVPPLAQVTSVNGLPPEQAKLRPRFRDLTPIYPNERLVMENGQQSITGRVIDLVAPIGKGQRGLIVSPPKAGKTTVLKNICQSISANNPEVHLICLLVDERPEEVTDMQRSIKGDVVASTFDMPADNHTKVAELVIERAKRLVEQGEDVVVVLDSITRLARAYNLAAPASGRILSGGVDSAALYPPKRFLGAARNIENGGSLTILASALIDTGSKMDEVIFEEFKGTGNMELKLDRELADKRVFPAVDPVASGTRNEDLLMSPQMAPFVWGLRRVLANMNNPERAEMSLVKGLKQTKTNEEFLIRSAKKAAQTDYVD